MKDQGRRLVFRHTVEGLFERAYGERIGPELAQQLSAFPLKSPTLDAALFGQAFAVLRDGLFPGVPAAEAEKQMGERFLEGYFETVLGGLVKTMLRLLPVEKAIARIPQSLMSGANFIRAHVEPAGPREKKVVMNDYSTSPDFLCGVVAALVRRTGVTPDVEVIERNGRALTLRVRWT